jgi:outer membrane protein
MKQADVMNSIRATARALSVTFFLCLAMVPGASATDLRIGVINTVRVMDQSPQADAASKQLQQEFEPRQNRLAKIKEELAQKQQQDEKDGLTMSESDRRNLEKQIDKLTRDLKVGDDEFREDLRARKAEELGKVQKQIFEVIRTMAQEEKYDLILSDSAVIYAGKKADITDDLLARLKKTRD